MTIDQVVLDELWDFSDPAGSEVRLRAAGDDPELQTQVARALGLLGRFDEARELLNSISDAAPATRTRVALERGRLANSAGDPEAAIPLFAAAEALARAADLEFLEIDAIHMLAIADAARSREHAARGLDRVSFAETDRTRRWGVALHNNLGWTLHDASDHAGALAEFERTLADAIQFGTAEQEFFARWAIARTYRSQGRIWEALELQEALHAEQPDAPDVLEELGILRAY